MKKNRRVCIGGTFDRLHKGHKALIDKAFEIAGENGWVFIGITKGEIANKKKDVLPFNKRIQDVKKYLKEKGFYSQSEIQPIYDKYGPSIEGDFDAIIVSPETEKVAQEINRIRRKKRKKPLEIINIPFVLAENGSPISSTRIRKKEINQEGHLLEKD
ncbi:MAG: pantetheine-phosphate adenylyltransferase [Thermoplasmata archaeon]|nr:MAG: pantetheine-phosphate adenylyltransferase [Thermoplasmata archaeon]